MSIIAELSTSDVTRPHGIYGQIPVALEMFDNYGQYQTYWQSHSVTDLIATFRSTKARKSRLYDP